MQLSRGSGNGPWTQSVRLPIPGYDREDFPPRVRLEGARLRGVAKRSSPRSYSDISAHLQTRCVWSEDQRSSFPPLPPS